MAKIGGFFDGMDLFTNFDAKGARTGAGFGAETGATMGTGVIADAIGAAAAEAIAAFACAAGCDSERDKGPATRST